MNRQKQPVNKHNPFASKSEQGGGLTAVRELDPTLMHALVYEAAMHGAVVSFGVTKDLGAASLALLIDGELHREYANSPKELSDLCDTLNEWLKSMDGK